MVVITEVANSGYQYKYNGKELQDELGLNWYDYGARNYDAALGRFMNIDKFAERFETLSPYQYANNTPTFFIDKNGEYIYTNIFINKKKQELRYNEKTRKFYYHGGSNNGKVFNGTNAFISSLTKALGDIYSGGDVGKGLITSLSKDKRGLLIGRAKKTLLLMMEKK